MNDDDQAYWVLGPGQIQLRLTAREWASRIRHDRNRNGEASYRAGSLTQGGPNSRSWRELKQDNPHAPIFTTPYGLKPEHRAEVSCERTAD